MTGLCDGLMVSTPGHPVQNVLRVADRWCEDERPQDPDELGTSQRDEAGRYRHEGVGVAATQRVERVGEPRPTSGTNPRTVVNEYAPVRAGATSKRITLRLPRCFC